MVQGKKTDGVGRAARAGTVRAGRVGLLILLVVLASAAIFGAACGGGPEPAPEPTSQPAPTATAQPAPTATPQPALTATPQPEPTAAPEAATDDALTRAYVMEAIDFYEGNGLDATVEFYSGEGSVENERFLVLIDADGVFLAMPFQQDFIGRTHVYADVFLAGATAEGAWLDHRGFYVTVTDSGGVVGQGPLRSYAALHDGLIFVSSHSVLLENVAEATRDYVGRAIALYESDGLEATIDFYNSPDSLEGRFYLFLIGADDLYLAHPIFPHLIGTDIKDVVGSDGQELGREIAQATEQGIWVEYLWPDPVTRVEGPKTTWAVRHDGLIFASGYYAASDTAEPPAWTEADPRDYTVAYVERAIERYERDGLDAMKAYYNSVASFEGEYYLFVMDEADIYIVHPLLPRLIGTDIKDVVGKDLDGNDYELGRAIAGATGDGLWVDYLWPHPVTLQDVPKAGYAVRHDGLIFASGYYPKPEDPAADAQAYVREAIEYYEAEGLDATIARYNSEESIEGASSLLMVDDQGILVVSPVVPGLVGMDASMLSGLVAGEPIGAWFLGATEEGSWHQYLYPSTTTAGVLTVHIWIVRHDGHAFSGAYFEEE